ncbi:MAG: hypothetical protein Hens3KO_11910 [Henriciella sp.]
MKRFQLLALALVALSGSAMAQFGDDLDFLTQPDEEEAVSTFVQNDTARLRALDKITGRYTDFEMRVGTPKIYGSLRIDLETCYQKPPEEPPESVAFLKITSATSRRVQTMAVPRDLTEDERLATEGLEADLRFSGWMYASSPGFNALEDPVYDIWVIHCSAVAPQDVSPNSGE